MNPQNPYPAIMSVWPVRAVLAIYIALCSILFSGFASPDLHALYLAASNFAQGNVDAVYPAPTPIFDLSVPPSWDAQATSLGLTERPLYPYIYPPLWAALFAPLTGIVDPHVMAQDSLRQFPLPQFHHLLCEGFGWRAPP